MPFEFGHSFTYDIRESVSSVAARRAARSPEFLALNGFVVVAVAGQFAVIWVASDMLAQVRGVSASP